MYAERELYFHAERSDGLGRVLPSKAWSKKTFGLGLKLNRILFSVDLPKYKMVKLLTKANTPCLIGFGI